MSVQGNPRLQFPSTDTVFVGIMSVHFHDIERGIRIVFPAAAEVKDIKELMEVCQYYFKQTGRRITFEYSLVGGVNDTEEDARELIAWRSRCAAISTSSRSTPLKSGIMCSRIRSTFRHLKINLKVR